MPTNNNLPRIEVSVKDGNLVLPAEDYGTSTVLIIAPTSDTIVEDVDLASVNPRRIASEEDYIRAGFGSFDKTSPLARKWSQVHNAGCRDIYLQAIPNTSKDKMYENLHKIYANIEEAFVADIILVDGAFADDEVTTANISLTSTPREDFVALGGMAKATVDANGDPILEQILGITETVDVVLPKPLVPGTLSVTFNNADSTTRVLLEGDGEDYTYDPETRTISFSDTVVISDSLTESIDVEYNTYEFSLPLQLAAFCRLVSVNNGQVLGVMSAKPIDPSKIKDLVEINSYIKAQKEHVYNQYLQVVGGNSLYFEISNEPYIDTFSGTYAGIISILPSYSSPTNKPIPGALFPAFNLSPSQANKLAAKNIVVPRVKKGNLVIADAMTTASKTSDFTRLTTVRIVNDAVELIREISDPYIGEPNSLARRNSLETAIRQALNNMIKRGALNDFRFNIKATIADQIEGNMRIALDLVPVFETRRIFLTVALKPTL